MENVYTACVRLSKGSDLNKGGQQKLWLPNLPLSSPSAGESAPIVIYHGAHVTQTPHITVATRPNKSKPK